MPRTHGEVRVRDDYQPPRWLPGPHLPTIWASLCRRVDTPPLTTERVELADGDFVDLAWTPRPDGPLVLILHGLEGSADSSYARALLAALEAAGLRGVVLQFRGCNGTPNRLPRSYHSGDTADLDAIVRLLQVRTGAPLFGIVGYSLGGNVLLKWLAQPGTAERVRTAIAVSVPFDLGACATRLNQGFSRLYQWRLVRSMQAKYQEKFRTLKSPLTLPDRRELNTFWAWDDAVTAPLHGFRDVHDYYQQSSCRQYLHAIRTPTLIVQALDDPFVPATAIPEAAELSPSVTLEVSARGGHVGFIGTYAGDTSGYWLEPRVLDHLRSQH